MWGRFNSSAAKRVAIAATLLIALAVAAAVAIAASGPADPLISSGPANPTNATSAAFSFSAPPSGGSNQCRLDAGAMAACTTPTTKSYSGLASGSHTFAVQAVDNKGKTSNVVTYTWVVDVTAPSVASITRLDATPTNASSVRWSVVFSENVTGVDTADFTRTVSGLSGTSISGISGSGTTYTVTAATGSGDGTLNIKLADDDSIKDTAGNKLGGAGAGNGDFSGPAYTLDRTAPLSAPSITGGPTGTVASTSASFTFLSSEAAVASFQCMRDGSAWASCSSPQAYSGLGQGAHSFSVRALDTAGNAGPGATRSWIADTVAPAAPQLGQKPPDPSTTATTTFSWTDSSPDVAAYECSRENGAFQACSSPLTYAAATTSSGQHQFAVRAIDGAGNVSAITFHQWKIDRGSPQQFTINGSVSGLVPGVAKRVPVVLTNPNDVPIYVTGITTTLSSDPGSSGCGLSNFEVLQSSASSADPVAVPANGMITLSGALDGYAPRVRLIDLPVNQDACKGVVLSLRFTGSAHS